MAHWYMCLHETVTLMNTVFEKEINSFVLVYLDDILIYRRSMGDHWDHLRNALEKLCNKRVEFIDRTLPQLTDVANTLVQCTDNDKYRKILWQPSCPTIHGSGKIQGTQQRKAGCQTLPQ